MTRQAAALHNHEYLLRRGYYAAARGWVRTGGNMTHSIGEARDPKPDDPRFASFEEARAAAVERSETDDRIFAVWGDARGEILALVYEGLVYRP